MKRTQLPIAIAILGALAALGAPRAAHAAPLCTSLPNPVYVTGSTALQPLINGLAPILAAANPPITIVYKGQGSCAGMDNYFKTQPLLGAGLSYYDANQTAQTCDLDATGAPVDVAVSDVFATTCDPTYVTSSTIGDFKGPVQAMTFAVNVQSPEVAISAEAAYFAFGFGAESGVSPWIDPTWLLQRGAGSGTQQMIAKAIGVPAASWFGTVEAKSSDMLKAIQQTPKATATIGILASDLADDNFSTVKVLFYQHYDQKCGYQPDVNPTPAIHNKQNVRDGHYAIWGPIHFITDIDVFGDPKKDNAKSVIYYLTGKEQAPGGLNLISLEAQHHVVPQCAMHVDRTEEMGPLTSSMPPHSCGCYFDSLTSGTSCKTCTVAGDCGADAPACNFGYCELQ